MSPLPTAQVTPRQLSVQGLLSTAQLVRGMFPSEV